MKLTSRNKRRIPTVAVWALSLLVVGAASATAGGKITGAHIENGSIRGVDVRNGSLGWNDLSAGTKQRLIKRATKAAVKSAPGAANAGAPGQAGKDGAPGLAGKDGANGAPGMSEVYVSNSTIVVPKKDSTKYVWPASEVTKDYPGSYENIRSCPEGRVAISGGYTVVSKDDAGVPRELSVAVSAPHLLTKHAGENMRTASAWRHVFVNNEAVNVEVLPWIMCATVK